MSSLVEMKVDYDDFEDLLDAAESEAGTGWEMDFVDDLKTRFDTYGVSLYVSEKQLEILRRIAGDD